jgi:Flp pilus assembly pilin Flp
VLKLSAYVQNLFFRVKEEEGQTMAEYGVILAVITAGVLLAIQALSGGVSTALTKVVAILNGN